MFLPSNLHMAKQYLTLTCLTAIAVGCLPAFAQLLRSARSRGGYGGPSSRSGDNFHSSNRPARIYSNSKQASSRVTRSNSDSYQLESRPVKDSGITRTKIYSGTPTSSAEQILQPEHKGIEVKTKVEHVHSSFDEI